MPQIKNQIESTKHCSVQGKPLPIAAQKHALTLKLKLPQPPSDYSCLAWRNSNYLVYLTPPCSLQCPQ